MFEGQLTKSSAYLLPRKIFIYKAWVVFRDVSLTRDMGEICAWFKHWGGIFNFLKMLSLYTSKFNNFRVTINNGDLSFSWPKQQLKLMLLVSFRKFLYPFSITIYTIKKIDVHDVETATFESMLQKLLKSSPSLLLLIITLILVFLLKKSPSFFVLVANSSCLLKGIFFYNLPKWFSTMNFI